MAQKSNPCYIGVKGAGMALFTWPEYGIEGERLARCRALSVVLMGQVQVERVLARGHKLMSSNKSELDLEACLEL
jgi:hypothetical protein